MKKLKIILILVLALSLFTACTTDGGTTPKTDDDPINSTKMLANSSILITGDVKNETILENFGEYATENTEIGDKTHKTISITEVLAMAEVYDDDSRIIFASFDGVMSEVALTELTNARLAHSAENGWQIYAPDHPPQAGIKKIEQIVVVATKISDDLPFFGIIDGERETTLSYGQLYNENAMLVSVLEGSAKKNDFSVDAYTRREIIPIKAYTASDLDSVIGYFADGSEELLDANGYFEWRGQSVDYIGADGKERIPHLIGIWTNISTPSLTDIRRDIDDYQGDVLFIQLDGLGYVPYMEHEMPYLNTQEVYKMRTVMPSISPVGLAAMLTGATPDVNGIHDRNAKDLLTDDIFTNKDSVVVEGHTKLINLSVDQKLNADENADGSTDDEIFATAIEALAEKKSRTFIHFHGFDDVAHTYGAYSDEAATKALELDGYVKQLAESFEGLVIITADHGMHDTNGGEKVGDHGLFLLQDMTVPYFIFEVNQ